MKWTAQHSDGFTHRLLSWTLHVADGQAMLDARWSKPEPATQGFLKEFLIDEEPLERALPAIRQMNERYEATFDDVNTQRLVIELPGGTIRRDVYGGCALLDKQPKLRPFLEFFAWLEKQVLVHLPHASDG